MLDFYWLRLLQLNKYNINLNFIINLIIKKKYNNYLHLYATPKMFSPIGYEPFNIIINFRLFNKR
jgi:hypothetical protein